MAFRRLGDLAFPIFEPVQYSSEEEIDEPLAMQWYLTLSDKSGVLRNKQQQSNGGSIPVRKIFVCNVPKFIDKQGLLKCFEAFGMIFAVSLPVDEHNVRRKYAFVTYYDPKAAARALASKFQRIHGHKVYIYAADQWHQPIELPNGAIQWFRGEANNKVLEECVKVEPNLFVSSASASTSDIVEPVTSINQILNDDCLRHIFSQLSLRELIGIERVCKRWRTICLGIWHTVATLDFKKTFKPKPGVAVRTDYFRELLLRCGDHITSLDISNLMSELAHERVLPLISKYCKNLRALNISGIKFRHNEVFVNTVGKNLKCLFLTGYGVGGENGLPELLDSAKDLEVLSLAGSAITAKLLTHLSQKCTLLNINSCFGIKDLELRPILKGLNNLEKFYASACNLSFDTLLDVAPTLTVFRCSLNLRSAASTLVNLSTGNSIKGPMFPRLQVLEISGAAGIDDAFLYHLVVQCPELERLKLTKFTSSSFYDPDPVVSLTRITDKGLKQLSKLNQLHTFSITHCPSLTSEALEHLAASSRGRFRRIECKNCCNVDDSGPMRLITLCPMLTHLDLASCSRISPALLSGVVSALNLRTNNVSLTLDVTDTLINLADIESHRHELLKIPFGCFNASSSNSLDSEDWETQSIFMEDFDLFDLAGGVYYDSDLDNFDTLPDDEFYTEDDEDDDDDDDDDYFDEVRFLNEF